MMHFLDFSLIYAHLSRNFVAAICALFPQIFWDWKVKSTDFFTFRMYASVWILSNREHSEYLTFYVVRDVLCPSLNMNSQIVESWQGKFSVYKRTEPINNICLLEQKQVKESNFLIIWRVDINAYYQYINTST